VTLQGAFHGNLLKKMYDIYSKNFSAIILFIVSDII
jgi:hypothetical protein